MFSQWLRGGYLPLLIVILLFTGSLGFSFRNMLKHEGASQIELTHLLWAATQLEVEHLRFVAALDRMAIDGGAANRRELKRRFDVLWSRPSVLLEGEGGAAFRAIDDNEALVRNYQGLLRALEPEILGLQPGDMKTYRRIRDRFDATSLPLHNAVRATFHATDKERVFRGRDLDDSYVFMATALVGVVISGGLLIVLLLFGMRRANRAEAESLKARHQAEAASRAKGEFLAGMSHELRTPLNAIIGFAEVIRNQTFGPIGNQRYAEYIEDIYHSGGHLLDVIGDILDTAKIEAGELDLDEENLDIDEVLNGVMRIAQPRAAVGKVSLGIDISENFPQLRGDRRLIHQIVLNLVANAIKFTPEGGRVTVETELPRDGRPHIRVRDTGLGMTEVEIEKALSPYGQIDSGTKGEREGTGLGLPLSRSFAELHGAELMITSVPGSGTLVTVVFPAERIVARSAAA